MDHDHSAGSSELADKVEGWITSAGYALEMRVAQLLSNEGLAVVQSEGYEDPKTAKLREIDVVAYQPGRGNSTRDAFVIVPIECKRSRSRPWVLFSSTHEYTTYGRLKRTLSTQRANPLVPPLSDRGGIEEMILFEVPELVGYSLVSAVLGGKRGKDEDNRAFQAVKGVKSAASAILEQYKNFASFVWPLVVLEGRLFQTSLKPDRSIAVTEVERGLLAWRQAKTIILITIMTEEGLRNCVDRLAGEVRRLAVLAKEELDTKNPAR